MHIQVNTDRNIEGREALSAHVNTVVTNALSHVSEHVTRVEVHLSDENGQKKSDNDKRCMMEARLGHIQPIAVTHQTDNLDQAIRGASDKLIRSIESHIGKLRDQKLRNTEQAVPGPATPEEE
jgi:ribosome-associated translation inhibitor RaiA